MLVFSVSTLRTVCCAAALLLGASLAPAANTYTVDRTTDVGDVDTGAGSGNSGDLRYCVNLANGDPGSTIFLPPGQYVLQQPFLQIVTSMTIRASIQATISGNNAWQIFFVNMVINPNDTVTFQNLNLINGRAQGGAGGAAAGGGAGLGGAILANIGNVVLDNVTFSGNAAVGGNGGGASGAPGGGGGLRGSGGGSNNGGGGGYIANGGNGGGGGGGGGGGYRTSGNGAAFGFGGGGGGATTAGQPNTWTPGAGGGEGGNPGHTSGFDASNLSFGGGGGGGALGGGTGGNGALFGGGGGGNANGGPPIGNGGHGGDYGGGGGSTGRGGNGGYGGGGGGGVNSGGGNGGFGGGNGGSNNAAGGGGSGFGGAVFVRDAARLTVLSTSTIPAGTVAAGSGPVGGTGGQAAGSAIYLEGTNRTLTVTNNSTQFDQTISGSITSNSTSTLKLDKFGVGTVNLTGVNTFGGTVAVQQGTLRLAPGASLGGLSALTVAENGGTLDLNGASLAPGYFASGGDSVITNSNATLATLTFNTGFSNSRAYNNVGFTKVGAGEFTIRQTNFHTGPTLVSEGTLTLDNGDNDGLRIPPSSAITIATGAKLLLVGNRFNCIGLSPLTIRGTLDAQGSVNNAHTLGNITLDGGTMTGVRPDPTYGNFVFNGSAVSVTANSTIQNAVIQLRNLPAATPTVPTFDVAAGRSLVVSSLLTDTAFNGSVYTEIGGLIKNGPGTLLLGAANTYSWGTIVNAGSVVFYGSSTAYQAPATANAFVVNAPGTVRFDRDNTFGNHPTVPTTAVVLNGALAQNGAYFTTLNNLTLNGVGATGAELRSNGGFAAIFPGYQLKGTVTVGGTAGSSITATTTANAFNAIQLGNNAAGGSTTFNVGVTGSPVDLAISTSLQDGQNPGATGLVASGLVKTGAGTLRLGVANTYSGGTSINGGVLVAASASALGTGALNFGGGTLRPEFGGTLSNFTVTAGQSVRLDTNGNNLTLGLGLTGTAGLVKIGAGTLTLTQAGTNSGQTFLNGGTVLINNLTSLGSGLINSGAGSLQFGISGTFNTPFAAIGAASTLTLDTTGQTIVLGSALTGAGAFTKAGTGTLTLASSNTYAGGTTVTGAGTLRAGGAGSFGSTPASMAINNGGILDLNGFSFGFTGLSGNGTISNGVATAVSLTVGSGDVTSQFDGAINGTGTSAVSLTKVGTGTLTLAGNNTFTGGTTLSAGSLNANSSSALGTGNVAFTGGTLAFGFAGNLSNNFTAAAGQTFRLHSPGPTVTHLGTLSGAGVFLKTGAGTLALSGNNTGFSGGTTLGGGLLVVNNGNALGSGAITSGAGSLGFGFDGTFSATFAPIGTGTSLSIDTNGRTITLGQSLSGGGQLLKTGAGTLTLAATNAYTGGTFINGGTLKAAGPNGFGPTTSPLAVFSPGVLDLNGFNLEIGSLNGHGNVTNSVATPVTLTFGSDNTSPEYAGIVGGGAGAINLVKVGTGFINVVSSQTYTGTTNINGGTIRLAGSGSLYSNGTLAGSSVVIGSGGALAFLRNDTFGNFAQSPVTSVVIGAGGLAHNLANVITTLGTVTLNDGGELRSQGGINAVQPAFQIRGPINAGGTSASNITVGTFGSFRGIAIAALSGLTDFVVNDVTGNAAVDLTVGPVLQNGVNASSQVFASGLRKSGAGTLLLNGANTYTGATVVDAGTLALGASSTLGVGGAISVAAGATLDLSAFGTAGFTLATGRTLDVVGSILGTLNVTGTLQGSGALSLGLTVNNGGLVTRSGGTLTLTGAVVNNGTIRLTGGAVFNAGGATSFVNTGLIDLLTASISSTLPANFSNSGAGLVLLPGLTKVKSASRVLNGDNTTYTVTVTIDGYAGHNYTLQRSSGLAAGSFSNVAGVPTQPGSGTLTPATLTFVDSASPAGEGFYRFAVSP